ncbi:MULTISPECIES: hypothetical protein [Pseudoalteromonas]|uniref:hypothetical protein n=1 Tax=Pseudoalteromonas TaxID=53246 RepID=UPI000C32FE2C|nr:MULTISPECIES: hypothetical protein [Pseudoalteromonas]PKG64723.1 hypothetical protein CXF75_10815 [Pseudoalteromonas arctica]PKG71830.1 hypothetical protein CXF64_04440 [Pseudoalteromonas sp. GutCa3]
MIAKLVESFKHALICEINEAKFVDAELSGFPFGSCEVTSQMLALFLESQGVRGVTYTLNQLGDYFHYWVVVDDKLIIDLTAHQFSSCISDCIITSDSLFHKPYKFKKAHKPSYDLLERQGSLYGYTRFYKSILDRVKNT